MFHIPFAPRRLVGLCALCALAAPGALSQDRGDVMQIYERARQQVEQLNETASLARNQMAATKQAVAEFTAADSPHAVEAATQRSLAEFRKTDTALENLGRLLGDLSESFGGLGDVANSEEGARQIETLTVAIDNADRVFSRLADSGGMEGSLARLSEQQLNLLANHLKSQEVEQLRREAATHAEGAASAPSNLGRLSELLTRLSVMVRIVEINNEVNRELILAMALRNAPSLEKQEALKGIIGDFGAPDEMVQRVDELAGSLADVTADLIGGFFITGAAFPDFSEEEVSMAIGRLNRVREETCEQCTDGFDNDLDGTFDAEESATCRMFVQHDPHCVASNTNR